MENSWLKWETSEQEFCAHKHNHQQNEIGNKELKRGHLLSELLSNLLSENLFK